MVMASTAKEPEAEEKLLQVTAPPPSIFYKKYTNNALQNGTAPPPPTPPDGDYNAFGIAHNPEDPKSILAPLREHGVTQLYQDASNDIKELKKLNSSLVVNFLDLLDILIQCPSSPLRTKKLEELELLFCNFHHLVNKFRPHQALETLIQMVKIQKDQKINLIEQINSKMECARAGLHTTINSLPSSLALDISSEMMDESMTDDPERFHSNKNEFDNVLSDIEMLIDRELGNT